MNILICDDQPAEARQLEAMLRDARPAVNTVLCHSGAAVLGCIRCGEEVDACFLDILMPEMTGVQLAEILRQEGYRGGIVFLTSSNEYAAESYAVQAASYLLKPPTAEKVAAALRRLETIRDTADTGSILVREAGAARAILFREISHIEVIQHKVYFRLIDGSEIVAAMTFSEAASQLLRDSRFVRCRRSYVVNMDDISAIAGREIRTGCGVRIPVSKSYPAVKHQYLQWAFRGNGS